MATEATAPNGRLRLAAVALLVAAAVGTRVLPVKEGLQAFLDWTKELGPAGPLLLVAAYTIACVLLLPGSILTAGAGLAFGFWTGVAAASAGSTLGACAAFWVGRTVGRDWVAARVRTDPRLVALDRAVGREGWKIVLLTRLSPVFPFNLLNYFYGLTGVGFAPYALASWLGMLPGTCLFVMLGTLGRVGAEAATGQANKWNGIMTGVGLAATLAVTVYVARLARTALAEALAVTDPIREEPVDHGT